MDYINLISDDLNVIRSISKSSFYDKHTVNKDKDIFRIGNKGVKVVLKKHPDTQHHYRVIISLKPHYYINKDVHNADRLNIYTLHNAITEITNKLNITNLKERIKITQLDFGLNVIPDETDTKDIIEQSLFYKKKPLNKIYSHIPYFKTTKQLNTHPTITAKIYHKGIQFQDFVHPNMLRYQIALATARKLETQFKIKTLADLTIETITDISKFWLSTWDNILILDKIDSENELHNPEYYYNKWHYRNGITNAKKNYYIEYGLLHKQVKSLLDFELMNTF